MTDITKLEDSDGYILLTEENKPQLIASFIEWLNIEGAEVAWCDHSGMAMNFSIGPDPRKIEIGDNTYED